MYFLKHLKAPTFIYVLVTKNNEIVNQVVQIGL